jgi:hypothetical protein
MEGTTERMHREDDSLGDRTREFPAPHSGHLIYVLELEG